jgi:hypothetical protein
LAVSCSILSSDDAVRGPGNDVFVKLQLFMCAPFEEEKTEKRLSAVRATEGPQVTPQSEGKRRKTCYKSAERLAIKAKNTDKWPTRCLEPAIRRSNSNCMDS